MHVLIATESFHPSVNGVARSVATVSRELRARGHRVTIIAPGPGPAEHEGAEVIRLRSVRVPGFRAFPIGVAGRWLADRIASLAPDVVHLASPFVVGTSVGSVARDLGIPIVAVYQTDVAGFATQYRLGPLGRVAWARLRDAHAVADVTLAPSSAALEDLRRQGVERLALWPRGVDVEAFSPVHRIRPPHGAGRIVRIGYVGRLAREKQVHLLAGLDRIEGAELVIIGDGPTRAELERRLTGATFTGVLHGAALSRAYADLDIFVHPGLHETFCQAVQEALAAGVPVVAAGSGGPLDLVRDGVNGLLVDPAREGFGARLRGAVARLAVEHELRARLAAPARPSVRHRTWHVVLDQLQQHYAEVIHRRMSATRTVPGAASTADVVELAGHPAVAGRSPAVAERLRRAVGG
jgi:phosphatidylinositol alpha 1,6-mannosyltransferase